MPTRKAAAEWKGGLRGGTGNFEGESGAIGGRYSFGSRFEESPGSNPEELLAAAEAACFSMALAGALERNGTPPESVRTEAHCSIEKVGDGFSVTRIRLHVRASVPGIDEPKFLELAESTKTGCPISRAIQGNVALELDATLE